MHHGLTVDSVTRALGRRIRAHRSTQLHFGPPHHVGDTTIIPVAETRMRLGVGAAVGATGGALAGGGALRVEPVGVITVRGERADYTPIRDQTRRVLLGLAVAALLLGLLVRLAAGRAGESPDARGG
ncbi:MAG TPA: spore germination protein GerW family protein [Thermomicrobiaceae bacterium]|nr:spore germination protein GerW family protein [Thermomicrobiaceae bacterium]